MINLATYLARVNLNQRPPLSEDGLFALHQAQFYTIPFENLSIQLAHPVRRDLTSLENKLLHQQRGGYCFELNELMRYVLISLGFAVRPLLARVHLGETPSGKTHQLNLVRLRERYWLMDVGFGAGGPRYPIPIESGANIDHAIASYRLIQQAPWGWLLQTRFNYEPASKWQNSYSFTLDNVTQQDLNLGNFYTSNSPDVHFTKSRTVSLPTVDGRKSISNFTFTHWHKHNKTEHPISDDESYLRLMEKEFAIHLGVPYTQLKPL